MDMVLPDGTVISGTPEELKLYQVAKVDTSVIDYMKKEAEKAKKIGDAKEKIMIMAEDLGKLSKEDMKKKYGNPSRAWALAQWELVKAKKGLK